jgi:hypothetical protein
MKPPMMVMPATTPARTDVSKGEQASGSYGREWLTDDGEDDSCDLCINVVDGGPGEDLRSSGD